jgi:hypothetical protein
MSLNPYAQFLEGRDPVILAREYPAKLTEVAARLGEAGMARSLAPGKWTAAQILSHLADTEIAFSFRLRQALAEDNPTIQPFDQDHWATHYASFSGEDALKVFVALRQWNLLLLDQLSAKDWERPTNHPERGAMTFGTIIETLAGHDRNHLVQLEQITRQIA